VQFDELSLLCTVIVREGNYSAVLVLWLAILLFVLWLAVVLFVL